MLSRLLLPFSLSTASTASFAKSSLSCVRILELQHIRRLYQSGLQASEDLDETGLYKLCDVTYMQCEAAWQQTGLCMNLKCRNMQDAVSTEVNCTI